MKKHLFFYLIIAIYTSTVAYSQQSSRLINAITVDSTDTVTDSTSYLYKGNRTYAVYDSNIISSISNLHINRVISSITFPLKRITSVDEELYFNNKLGAPNSRFLKYFDSTGNCTEIITQKKPNNTINWENLYKDAFSYAKGKLLQYDGYGVHPITNQWNAFQKYVFSYNPQNKLNEYSIAMVHNGIDDTARIYKYYYSSNRLDSLIKEDRYGDTTKYSFIYSGNLISNIYFFINNKSDLQTTYTFFYDSSNNNIETTAIHTPPNPANDEVAYFHYTSSNLLDSIAYFVNYPNHTSFHSTKIFHNPFNQITELDFSNGYKKIFRYDNITTEANNPSFIGNNIVIYPSPTHDFINIDISFHREQSFTATITDVQGRVWATWSHPETKVYQKKIAINDWINGNYFFILQTKKGRASKPFTVLH